METKMYSKFGREYFPVNETECIWFILYNWSNSNINIKCGLFVGSGNPPAKPYLSYEKRSRLLLWAYQKALHIYMDDDVLKM